LLVDPACAHQRLYDLLIADGPGGYIEAERYEAYAQYVQGILDLLVSRFALKPWEDPRTRREELEKKYLHRLKFG
jgi:hypothetical protein